MNLQGKKLLILGGTYASYNLVQLAKEMGIYTVVTDYYDSGMAKDIADETVAISTTDTKKLCAFIKANNIDGVFCGPSEFNIRNMIQLCEASGMPCYTTIDQWNKCANKDEFTQYCREYSVDVPEEYEIHDGIRDEELEMIDYPIIIKPVDGSSSVGISVCRKKEQVIPAYQKAMATSKCKRIIAEKYIENGGELFGARYLVQDGEAYPYLLIDTYIADPINGKSLISAFTLTPSKYSEYYMANIDRHVREMIKGMGIKKGTVFFQSLPYKGKIYFHEMGYRLSGGMIYKLTEPLMGINDMKMMIRCALGGECICEEERKRINIKCNGKYGAQLMIPLNAGTIGKIVGLEKIMSIPCVTDFIQYYRIGDIVKEEYIGTLQQHFGRFTMIANDRNIICNTVEEIQSLLLISDVDGNRMNVLHFELSRL